MEVLKIFYFLRWRGWFAFPHLFTLRGSHQCDPAARIVSIFYRRIAILSSLLSPFDHVNRSVLGRCTRLPFFCFWTLSLLLYSFPQIPLVPTNSHLGQSDILHSPSLLVVDFLLVLLMHHSLHIVGLSLLTPAHSFVCRPFSSSFLFTPPARGVA